MNFAELLETRAREKGEETFLLFGDERISHAELDRRANRIANGLAALGVGPGSGVAIMMRNSPTWLATFFATQKLGGYAVPVNVALRGEGLAYVVDHSESQALVIGADLMDSFLPLQSGRPHLRHVIVDTSEAPPGTKLPADAVPVDRLAESSAEQPGSPRRPTRRRFCCTPPAPPARPRPWWCRTARSVSLACPSLRRSATVRATSCTPVCRCFTPTHFFSPPCRGCSAATRSPLGVASARAASGTRSAGTAVRASMRSAL